MRDWRSPFGNPPEFLYVVLAKESNGQERDWPVVWVEKVLGELNWRSHLFVVGGEPGESEGFTHCLLDIAGAFLESRGFTNLHIHPLVTLDLNRGSQREDWDRMVGVARPFQHEAHALLSEARLHIAPILAPSWDTSCDHASQAAEFFNSRLAIPSFYLPGQCFSDLRELISTDDARFIVDPDTLGLPYLLWQNHVFETILERVDEGGETVSKPCRAHLVVDAGQGRVFSCFKQWGRLEQGADLGSLGTDPQKLPTPPTGGDCLVCFANAALSMRENLVANNRELEGRRVFFKLSLELAGRGHLELAAELALAAFEFSRTDSDRAAALIQQALCLREFGNLQQADEVLENAAEFTRDAGQIAYHRGRVQFVWRDYIEALEWYEKALDSGSSQVPVEDMCFEMALCHINIEEYPEARPYLDRAQKTAEPRVPVIFYRGVCDYGENRFETALTLFREALAAGPATEDLGRVLFYIGACLKELQRFDEAVDALREAVAADPDDITNHNLLGFCYYKLKRHEEAVACFLKAVEIDPSSGIDWANLASNLRDLGKTKEAIAMYKKALSLDPTIGFARDNLKRLAG